MMMATVHEVNNGNKPRVPVELTFRRVLLVWFNAELDEEIDSH